MNELSSKPQTAVLFDNSTVPNITIIKVQCFGNKCLLGVENETISLNFSDSEDTNTHWNLTFVSEEEKNNKSEKESESCKNHSLMRFITRMTGKILFISSELEGKVKKLFILNV